MDIRGAWAFGRQTLATTSYSPDLDARLLLQYVLQLSHSALVAHDDRLLSAQQESAYRSLVQRARHKEPVPYLTGHASFLGLDFLVNSAVLIPRPETEQLVEMALAWANGRGPLNVVDVGTGSGCVAIGLAHGLERSRLAATDISSDALNVARQNARRLAPNRIQFFQGHLLEPLPFEPDLVVANLPYVADHEWTALDDGVKSYEPVLALRGGANGLDLISELLQQAVGKIRTGGALFLEIGWLQGPSAAQLTKQYFPEAEVKITVDFAGYHRILSMITA